MTCEACANPASGRTNAACRACQIRELARGPLFFESMRTGKLTPEYRKALRLLGDETEVHSEVRASAKALRTGANP